ncbi:MAG: glycosyltransferase family 2 protein [Acidobacteriota bacterium]
MSARVSVAIATYNRASMVRESVQAALTQELFATEICVADDASSDHTWSALTALAQNPRVRIFRQEKNTGGVENWNFAIRQTTGDYIAWCSDDDRYLPGHLDASIAFLEAHPQIGMVHSGFIDAVETPAGVETIPRPLRFAATAVLDRGSLLRYLTRYYDWPFHPSTIVMRRSVWNAVGPFDAAYALADTDWFVRAVERFPVAMLARHGVLNRRHPGNWSNRLGSARMQREIFEIVEAAITRLLPRRPVSRVLWRAIWRANVRSHLLLTLRARLSTFHAEAACAVWRQLLEGTGLRLPGPFLRWGDTLICRWCARHVSAFEDARQSVSPL